MSSFVLVIGVDVGLSETTVVIMESVDKRFPYWVETLQWKAPRPIKNIIEAKTNIGIIKEWLADTFMGKGFGSTEIVGVETYEYQGEERAKNKMGPYVARLSGVLEGVAWCLSCMCFGVSRSEAIGSVGARTGKAADTAILKLINMPSSDQHAAAAALVGVAAYFRAKMPSLARASSYGSLGTLPARKAAAPRKSPPSSKAPARSLCSKR